jgi:hypothetical protein
MDASEMPRRKTPERDDGDDALAAAPLAPGQRWSVARWRSAAGAASGPGCPIRADINPQGVCIHHTPWSLWHDRTAIDEPGCERWSCDEAEAIAAGWQAARLL